MKEILFVVENGCHICTSHGVNDSGYPIIYLGKKAERVSRYVFSKTFGYWPTRIVRHSCDCRRCINPNHLFEGSRRDNSADAVVRKRFPVGEKHWSTSLSDSDVLYIFKSKKDSKFLAKKYGVHRDTINNIKSGRTWSWITMNKPRTMRYGSGKFLLTGGDKLNASYALQL